MSLLTVDIDRHNFIVHRVTLPIANGTPGRKPWIWKITELMPDGTFKEIMRIPPSNKRGFESQTIDITRLLRMKYNVASVQFITEW